MNLTRLTNDYTSLDDNEFWKLYLEKIADYGKSHLNMMKSAPLEKISHLQGELSAIDWVASLPALMAAQLAEQSKLKED